LANCLRGKDQPWSIHDVTTDLQDRVERQRRFFAGDKPGERLIFVRHDTAHDDAPPLTGLMGQVNDFVFANDGCLPEGPDLERIVGRTVSEFREYWPWRAGMIHDDEVPIISVHFDIGVQTAVMTGLEPQYLDGSWWLDANLDWDEIDALTFNPGNRWFRLFMGLNRLLWKYWEEDYFFLPFWHRSPLDAANGIRGNELFAEMYTDPEKVKDLTTWCTDTQIEIERLLYADAEGPEDWGIGHMSHWMPKGAVWVNGDPVALVGREMMTEFEQPFTGRLFTTTGGGYFHNHTKGIYQVDQVAKTPGIILQHFNADPNCPRVSDVLAGDNEGRERMRAASRMTPIFVDNVSYDELPAFRNALPEGRFTLDIICPVDKTREVLSDFRR
jgi:hypothetical protein